MNFNELKEKCRENNIELSDDQISKLDKYADFLVEYNEKINLTAITDKEEIIEKHFYDSILFTFNRDMHKTLVDVGTGAGFPGVVCKIVYPELKVILVETLNKRCIFLNELINLLELKDIEVVNSRGEDFARNNREKYDYVTARAVTNLSNLIEICGAMVKVNGYFIALRGLSGSQEIEDSKQAIKTMGFTIEETSELHLTDGSTRIISFFKKNTLTSKKYPRQYSIIKKRPL